MNAKLKAKKLESGKYLISHNGVDYIAQKDAVNTFWEITPQVGNVACLGLAHAKQIIAEVK